MGFTILPTADPFYQYGVAERDAQRRREQDINAATQMAIAAGQIHGTDPDAANMLLKHAGALYGPYVNRDNRGEITEFKRPYQKQEMGADLYDTRTAMSAAKALERKEQMFPNTLTERERNFLNTYNKPIQQPQQWQQNLGKVASALQIAGTAIPILNIPAAMLQSISSANPTPFIQQLLQKQRLGELRKYHDILGEYADPNISPLPLP